jgi:hypothetical protein
MSKISPPERGQPLDVSYIYNMAEAINDLADSNSALTQGSNFVIQRSEGDTQTARVYASKIVGQYQIVKTTSYERTITEHTAIFQFDEFAFPPIVTATVVDLGNTSSGVDVSLVIKSTTTQSCTIAVKFGSSGVRSIGVNLIAIGLPTI